MDDSGRGLGHLSAISVFIPSSHLMLGASQFYEFIDQGKLERPERL